MMQHGVCATNNAEIRKNSVQSKGLHPAIFVTWSVCGVAALGNGTAMPCALRLAAADFTVQRGHE